jgi:hypothetical protein
MQTKLEHRSSMNSMNKMLPVPSKYIPQRTGRDAHLQPHKQNMGLDTAPFGQKPERVDGSFDGPGSGPALSASSLSQLNDMYEAHRRTAAPSMEQSVVRRTVESTSADEDINPGVKSIRECCRDSHSRVYGMKKVIQNATNVPKPFRDSVVVDLDAVQTMLVTISKCGDFAQTSINTKAAELENAMAMQNAVAADNEALTDRLHAMKSRVDREHEFVLKYQALLRQAEERITRVEQENRVRRSLSPRFFIPFFSPPLLLPSLLPPSSYLLSLVIIIIAAVVVLCVKSSKRYGTSDA